MVSEKCSCWRETVHLPSAVEKHGASQCTYSDFGSFTDQGSSISDPPTPQPLSWDPPPRCPLTHLREDGRRPADPSPQNTAHSPGERGHTRYRMDNSYALAHAALAAWLTSGSEERRREERWEELVLPWIRIRGELVLIAGARLLGWSWVSSPLVLLQSFVLSAAAPWKWDLRNINSLIELLTSLMPFFSTWWAIIES